MSASGWRYDAATQSQLTFRCLLSSTARPGVLSELPPSESSPDTALLYALLDHETSFGTIGVEPEIAERLSRDTGARFLSPEEADFVLVRGGDSKGALVRMKRGNLEEPHMGATAIFAVQRLSSCGPLTLELSGPGVAGQRTLGIEGIATSEIVALRESRAEYPRGVDVYMVGDAGTVVALPRSTRLDVRESV